MDNKHTFESMPLGMFGKALVKRVGEDALIKDISNDPRIVVKNPELRKKFGMEADDLVLIGRAITTVKRYTEFTDSLALLCEDGAIMRYGEQIGTRADIDILKPEESN